MQHEWFLSDPERFGERWVAESFKHLVVKYFFISLEDGSEYDGDSPVVFLCWFPRLSCALVLCIKYLPLSDSGYTWVVVIV